MSLVIKKEIGEGYIIATNCNKCNAIVIMKYYVYIVF